MPRNLIEHEWCRTIATINPVSYLIEGIRSLFIYGWDAEALALAFGIAIALIVISIRSRPWPCVAGWCGHERGRPRIRSAALGVAWRSLHRAFTTPALLFPALIFPLFFLAAFAGGLSAVSQTPNFEYPEGYTTFIFGFVLLQSSALGGVFTGFSVAADFQFGMGGGCCSRPNTERRSSPATRSRRSCACS